MPDARGRMTVAEYQALSRPRRVPGPRKPSSARVLAQDARENALRDALSAILPVWQPCPSWQAHQWQAQRRGQTCTACGVFWGNGLLLTED